MKKHLYLFVLLFLLATNSNFAKINIRAMSDIAVQDRFPFLTVELKADQDGIPIEITKENLLIQEVNYTNSPYSIEKNYAK